MLNNMHKNSIFFVTFICKYIIKIKNSYQIKTLNFKNKPALLSAGQNLVKINM